METLSKWIDKILSNFLIVLMAVMVLDVSWQVFTRFVLRDASSYTEELANFLLIWIGVLGASYALRTKAHLGIDVLTYKLRGVRKQVVEIVIYSFVILFALFIMVIGGLKLVQLTFTLNQTSPALGIKMGYVYLVLPISGILIIYYSIGFIIKAIRGEFEVGHTEVEAI
ncbi:TRAP transporter small permease subunit [candidate division KSB1 bacterium]|nr:TRAP transporter small permease subunit [candidate division KSB1 bacterium]